MKTLLILACLFYSIDAKVTRPRVCRNCTGKIHTKQDLELAKRPLILNQDRICLNEKYEFFIIIKSGSFQRRNFTRSTWAKEIIEHFNIPVLYAIGYPKNSSMQKEILAENELFHDLLQFDFLDSYYNLTIKTTSVLLWYDRYCSKSSDYLFYVDDDVLIHVDRLIMYMTERKSTDTIEGWFEKSGKILRTGVGGITKEDFPLDVVPSYLWGAAVLYPSNIVSNVLIKFIFNTSLPIFFRDDVFVNAFIAEEAGIKREYMKGMLLYDPTEDALKTNMIVIDFTTEKDRERAWHCYKYNRQCNRNRLLSLFKICSGLSLFVAIGVYCCRCVGRMKCCQYLMYELCICFSEMKPVYTENINMIWMLTRRHLPMIRCRRVRSTMQYWMNSRRTYIRIVFIVVIMMILTHFVINK